MTTKKFTDLTPDERMEYYKSEPEAFEKLAKECIEELITSAPGNKQLKLRALQANINKEMSKYKDPTARLNAMVSLFWKGVSDFQSALKGEL